MLLYEKAKNILLAPFAISRIIHIFSVLFITPLKVSRTPLHGTEIAQ